MTTTTTLNAADLKTALAHRDREWEECLSTIDDRPPLTPDLEWFREWVKRVELTHNELSDSEKIAEQFQGAEDYLENVVYELRKAHDDGKREWSIDEIIALLKKELDEYHAQ